MDYVEQYIDICKFKKRRFALVDGQLFALNERWIIPIGPVHQAYHLTVPQYRDLLHKLGGLFVMWTDGFQSTSVDSEWYAVICQRHRDISEIADSKRRSEMRRALRECEVRMVDAEEIATNGYETYISALSGYRNLRVAIQSRQEFQRRVRTDAPFGDCLHQWGVYCSGKLVAFGQTRIYDRIGVDYAGIKINPDYKKNYPIYALIYKMNEYYLEQEKFKYVSDGFRSISHETNIQDFLIHKFGFEKVRTGLHLHFRAPIGQLLHFTSPFSAAIVRFLPKAKPIYELMRFDCKHQYV